MIAAHRRFTGVAIFGAGVLLGCWLLPKQWCENVIVHGGFWCAVISLIMAGWACWRHRSAVRRPDLLMLAAIVPVFMLLQLAQPRGWKIEPDEHVIAATARSMTLYHAAIVSAESWKTDSPWPNQAGVVDKRPLAFPALVATVNGLSGFRPGNVFAVNVALCALLLVLSWSWGHAWAGRWGGVVAVTVWANLPLAEYVFTGGGNDGFNATLFLAIALLTKFYFDHPSGSRLSFFIAVAVVLLQARYESVVLVAPFLCVVGVHAWRDRLTPPWFLWLTPLLLAPTAVIRRITSDGAWNGEMSQVGAGPRFSLDYIWHNLSCARQFLFATDGRFPNAPVVAWIAVCFAPLALFVLWKERNSPRGRAGLALLAGGLLSTAVSMGYFWGQWTDPLVSRTSMPFYVALLAPLLAAFAWLQSERRFLAAVYASTLVGGACFWTAAHSQADRYLPTSEFYSRDVAQFIEKNKSQNALWITSNPMQPVLMGESSVTIQRANSMAEAIDFSLRHKIYQRVFVIQWLKTENGVTRVADGMELDPALHLRTLQSTTHVPMWHIRISEVLQGSRVNREQQITAELSAPRF